MKYIDDILGYAIVPFVIDASSVINLVNSDTLDVVCNLRDEEIWITPLVVKECQLRSAAKVIQLNSIGKLQFVDDNAIPADYFLSLIANYGLGDGETESIAAAHTLHLDFCCDDRRARNLGKEIVCNGQVFGSLRLLRRCVEEELIDCESAFFRLEEMKNTGGFLPDQERSFFCKFDGC